VNVTIAIITYVCAMILTINKPPAEGWRGIVPLHSTRMDVERLLGSPRESRGVASTYDTEEDKVLVFYSAGPCKKGVSEEWNVPRDTVISLTVSPRAKLLVTSLHLNNDYNRVDDPHVQGIVHYFNREDGVRIDARVLEGEGEDINSITYEPAAKDNRLRCPDAPVISDGDENTPQPRKFDEYSNISFNDEKARLDNIAIYLQQKPEMKGYIIAYAGRRARVGEAQARADCAKNYLVNERGIQSERVVTMDGGYREKPMVELYLLPRGVSAPTATPTVDPSKVQIIKVGSAKNSNRRLSASRRKQRRRCQ
jgi:hypothetical protein